MKSNYLSRREVQELIRPELEWVRQHSVYAEYAEPRTMPIDYHAIVGECHSPANGATYAAPQAQQSVQSPFFTDHITFLREVASHPDASITEHYNNLGWGRGRTNRIKEELLQAGGMSQR